VDTGVQKIQRAVHAADLRAASICRRGTRLTAFRGSPLQAFSSARSRDGFPCKPLNLRSFSNPCKTKLP